MNTREILIAARKKIENEENWCRKSYARDKSGVATNPSYEKAHSFCAIGAIKSVRGDINDLTVVNFWKAEDLLIKKSFENYDEDITEVNDDPDYGHKLVLKIYDEVIKDLEEKAQ